MTMDRQAMLRIMRESGALSELDINDEDFLGGHRREESHVRVMELAYALARSELVEIDRNARAYGFEVGRGALLAEVIEYAEDNPFVDPNWHDQIGESRAESEEWRS